MSMMIFEESTVFNPSDYGLKVGDIIQVVCVGGGAGGSSGAAPGGAAGEGGKVCTYERVEQYTTSEYNESTGMYEDVTNYRRYLEYTDNPGGGGSGRGYGAGGGGGGGGFYECYQSSNQRATYYKYSAGGAGGGAGKMAIATVLIKTLDPIVITIGHGGEADMPGGSTSFGEYITAGGGNVGEGAVQSGGVSGTLTRSGSSVYEQTWNSNSPDSLKLTGGGGGEGGYIIGLPLGGKFDHNRDQTHAIDAKGNTGGNGLSVGCGIDKTNKNPQENSGGLTIAASGTSAISALVERGGCGGVYTTEGESVGIGHGVCIVTW